MCTRRERFHSNNPRGQYLVEVLVATGIFVMFATALSSLVVDASVFQRTLGQDYQKEWYLREGRQALRSVQEQGWDQLMLGTHGLTSSDGSWRLTEDEDVFGPFTRTVTIDWLTRNAITGDIDPAGDTDVCGKQSTITIRETTTGRTLLTSTLYHTLPQGRTWTETTQSDFSDGTFSNTQTTSVADGEVTIADQGQTATGFPFLLSRTISSSPLSRQTNKLSYRFTPIVTAPIKEVRIYVSSIRGTSPTYRVGIQSSNANSNPNGTWLGPNSKGFGEFRPTEVGWQTITLQEPVEVPKVVDLHLVVEWASGQINNQRNIRLLVSDPLNALDPFSGTAEPSLNTLASTDGTTWTETDRQPIFVLVNEKIQAFGNAYTETANVQIHATQQVGQRFTNGPDDTRIAGARFYVARNNQAPQRNLTLRIRDVTAGADIDAVVLATPSQVSRTFSWIEVQFKEPLLLPAGHDIRLELSSAGTSASRAYLVPQYSVDFASPYTELSYDSDKSFSEILAGTGSNAQWIGSPVQDIPFQLLTPGGPSGEGEYVSSVFDSQSGNTRFSALVWNGAVPPGSDIGVQIRIGASPGDIQSAEWQGPDGTPNTFFDPIASLSLSESSGQRYAQYKVVFSSNGIAIPILYDISWIYEQ